MKVGGGREGGRARQRDGRERGVMQVEKEEEKALALYSRDPSLHTNYFFEKKMCVCLCIYIFIKVYTLLVISGREALPLMHLCIVSLAIISIYYFYNFKDTKLYKTTPTNFYFIYNSIFPLIYPLHNPPPYPS